MDDELFDYKEESLMGSLVKTDFYDGGLNDLKTNIAIDLMLNEQLRYLRLLCTKLRTN